MGCHAHSVSPNTLGCFLVSCGSSTAQDQFCWLNQAVRLGGYPGVYIVESRALFP